MVPKGIPYSEFLSWKQEDQDLAIAWLQEQAAKCPSCGTVHDDWLDEDGRYLEPPPYEAISNRCLGCEALEAERALHRDGDDDRRYTVGLVKYRDKPDGRS